MGNILPDVFLEIVNMSITAAYVALAVIIIRLALKKAPKAVSYALWLVVLFRLVCPVSFSSPVSLMRMGNVAPAAQQGASVTYIQTPVAAYHVPEKAAAATAAPVNTASVPTSAAAAVSSPVETLLLIAAAMWAAGVAVMLVLSIASHIRLKRRISDATLLYDNIYETDAIQSPFVMGIFRPRIYLPSGMDSGDMEYVLRHERMHIHRRDNVVKPLAYAVLCLHWFNPLVWAAFYLMCADMEMSCDEKVLRGMGERDKACYGEALLKLSTNRRLLAGSPLAFGETPVKSRIKNVLKFKKPVFWIAAVAIVAAIAAGICLIANPSGTVSAGADSLYGNYKFEKQVYMNMVSSFLAHDGYEQYYTLDKDTLTITEASGEQKSIPITYERAEVSEQSFDASFMFADDGGAIGKPDISQYKQRCQYTLCKPDKFARGYRLYLMDDEIWLAELRYNEKLNGTNNEYIWSIYKIAKYGGELPKPQPSMLPDNPAAAPSPSVAPKTVAEGMAIAIVMPLDTMEGMGGAIAMGNAINDKGTIKAIKYAIASLSSSTYKAVDISKVENYITLTVSSNETGEQENYTYFVFEKDGRYCIQGAVEGKYCFISEDAYNVIFGNAKALHELYDAAENDPAKMPRDVEISMYIGGDSDSDVPIEDNVLKNYIQDIVIDYVSSPTTGEGIDISTLDSYLALSGQFTSDGGHESFYIFEKDGKHYIQNSTQGRYSIIDDAAYYELLDKALGYDSAGTMTITTGDNAVYALEHIISTEATSLHGDSPRLKPEQVAKYLHYLMIDPGKETLTPFTPYLNGEKAYGTYKLYDSEFNEIPVIQPSGLEPQIYLFANAPGPGTYIVELEATSSVSIMESKSQYFFGVMLTEKE